MPRALSAIIIDDEKWSRENLAHLLTTYCPEVHILAKVADAHEAKKQLAVHAPDVVFLDIEMPEMNGFDFLDSLTEINFEVIFVTAYDQYGIKAIKHQAFDYLLKPISIKELQHAVKKMVNRKKANKQQNGFDLAELESIRAYFQPKKISLPNNHGFIVLEPDEIIRLEADNAYTVAYFTDQRKQVFTKSLKFYEDALQDDQFLRVHKSHIVNLKHVKAFSRLNGAKVSMADAREIPVSRRKLSIFLDRIQAFTHIVNQE